MTYKKDSNYFVYRNKVAIPLTLVACGGNEPNEKEDGAKSDSMSGSERGTSSPVSRELSTRYGNGIDSGRIKNILRPVFTHCK